MIEINNLKKSFGNYTLFTIDKLSLPSKGLILIKGENGCGKTTFFNMLSMIDNHYTGEILINNKNYKEESDKVQSYFRKNNISYVFQKLNFISFLTIEKNQNIYYEIKDNKTKNDIHIADESNKTPIYKLSQGQQEKRRLDSGLNIQKNIYLLDEVLSSLDLKSREIYIKKIIELSKNSLVLIVSHDVDVEKYADEVYEFENHKLINLKQKEKNTIVEKKKHNYELKTHKIFFHYSLSIFLIILLNTILSSMFFSLSYLGCYANKDDSYIYLKQAFEKEGYLIFETQNDVTSSHLIKKFNGSCFEAYCTTIPVASINEEGEKDTVYCTQKTFNEYSKVDKKIANKKLVDPILSSESYKIEIDNNLNDYIFFKKTKNEEQSSSIYFKPFKFAFYDSDYYTKDELKNKYDEIIFESESVYKKSNTLNYKLEDDTFYVNNKKLISSKTVTKFMIPFYNSKNDPYEPDLNIIFPKGVKVKALDNLEDKVFKPTIVISDNTAKKLESNDHESLILIKDKDYVKNTFYLYNNNYTISNCNYFNSFDYLDKYTSFAYNKNNKNIFTYSIMLYFFFTFNLFLEFIIYFYIVSKNQHNFHLLRTYGMSKRKIFLHSIIPLIISLMIASLVGGLITLTQTKWYTFFISGVPTFILFIALFVVISTFIFNKGIKKHE